jgi:hypothetical protein
MRWMKNTSGKPDSMLTFAFIAFSVVTLNILLATFGRISFNGFEIGLQAMDASTMTAYLGATFTAYVTRRWTSSKYDPDEKKSEGKINE